MARFALVHRAWAWDLPARELEPRGHRVLTPELACEDPQVGVICHAAIVRQTLGGMRTQSLSAIRWEDSPMLSHPRELAAIFARAAEPA